MTADVAHMPAPKAMPGWYEVTGDPLDRFYWSGVRWIARARFVDGDWREHPMADGDPSAPPRPTTAVPVAGGMWDLPPSGSVGVFGGPAGELAGRPGRLGLGEAPAPSAVTGDPPASRGGVAPGAASPGAGSGDPPALAGSPVRRFALGAEPDSHGSPDPGVTERFVAGSVTDGVGSSGKGSPRDLQIGSARDPQIGSARDLQIGSARDPQIGSAWDPQTGSARDPQIGSALEGTCGVMRDLGRADGAEPIAEAVSTGGPGWSGGPVSDGGSGCSSNGEAPMADAERRNGGASGGGVELHLGAPMPQRRWTVALRGVLVIPHLVCLELVGIVVVAGVVVMWIVALATRQVPRRLWAFVWGWGRWHARVGAYVLLLTDRYPTFGAGATSYPVQFDLVPPAAVSRSEVLFRAAMALPAAMLAAMATAGLVPVGLVAWVATLVRGRLPLSFHLAFAAVVRFDARVHAFACLLTNAYPAAPLGDGPAAGANTVPSSSGSRSVMAWCFGAAPVVYAAIAVMAIPTFIGVSTVQQHALGTGRLLRATTTYGVVTSAAQRAVQSCAQGGSARGSGAPCVAAALDQWGQGADNCAESVAEADTSLPARTTRDAVHLLVGVTALASALARTAGSATPIMMLRDYEGPVRSSAAVVAKDITRLDAALAADR